jgi:uncharacterized repeat protein (TIGR02543 family)
MNTWLQNNVSQGNYVEIKDSKIFVWKDRASSKASTAVSQIKFGEKYPPLPTPAKEGYIFLGWQDPAGNEVKGGDTVALYGDITLTAKWGKLIAVTFDAGSGKLLSMAKKTTVTSINTARGADALVIYAGKATTGTNIYGTEVIVDSNGTVTEIRPYGYGNAPIPEGGFVLSGHDAGADWLKSNIAVGDTVTLDGLNISVYREGEGTLLERTVTFGTFLGALPTPKKNGATFLGWYTSDGIRVSQNTVATQSDTKITLIAKWA